jgi:hypothetical protein
MIAIAAGTSDNVIRDLPAARDAGVPPALAGRMSIAVRFLWVGDESAGARLLDQMRAAAPVLLDDAGVKAYPAVDSVHADPVDPMPVRDPAMLLTGLPDQAVARLLSLAGPGSGSPQVLVEVRQLGGAYARDGRRLRPSAGRRTCRLTAHRSAAAACCGRRPELSRRAAPNGQVADIHCRIGAVAVVPVRKAETAIHLHGGALAGCVSHKSGRIMANIRSDICPDENLAQDFDTGFTPSILAGTPPHLGFRPTQERLLYRGNLRQCAGALLRDSGVSPCPVQVIPPIGQCGITWLFGSCL